MAAFKAKLTRFSGRIPARTAESPDITAVMTESVTASQALPLRVFAPMRAALPNGSAAACLLTRQPNGVPLSGEGFGRFMALVHRDVNAVAAKVGSRAQASEMLRRAVASGQIGPDLDLAGQARMMYALYGVRKAAEAHQALTPLLSETPGFRSLPPDQAWRMLMDQSAWGNGEHAGLRFENEPGYLGGMYNGLGQMLEAHQKGRPFDVLMLKEFHDTAIRGVYGMKQVSSSASVGLRNEAIEITQPARGPVKASRDALQAGFHEYRSVHFFLEPQKNMTPAGLKECLDNLALHPETQRSTLVVPGRRDGVDPPKAFIRSPTDWDGRSDIKLSTPMLSREQNEAKGADIVHQFRQALPKALTRDDKLATIARCVQHLEQAHLFSDGNARTLGFLVLNKLLLESGLPPTMMANPNHFDGHSVAELVQKIKEGQQTFAAHCRAPATAPQRVLR